MGKKTNEIIKTTIQGKTKTPFSPNANSDYFAHVNDLNEDDTLENEDLVDENIETSEPEDVNDEELNEEITYLDSIIEEKIGKATTFSEKKVLFHIVKIEGRYKVFDTGFRSYGGLVNNFDFKLKFKKEIMLIHSCIQSYLDGFYDFEKIDSNKLFGMFPSHLFLRKQGKTKKDSRRSLFTKNYLRFENEVISMNLISPSGRPKNDKTLHTIFRIFLGENSEQKETFLNFAKKYTSKENILSKTGNVNKFFEKIIKYSEEEFPGLKIKEFVKTINKNHYFSQLLKNIRNGVDS